MAESVEQLDPTDDLTAEAVKKKTVKGAVILTGRNVLVQLISFFSTALLTIFLLPSEFGVFFLVSSVINFLAYFSDIGFAAALIQKKEKLDERDLRTVFTVQQILIVIILAVVFAITPLIKNLYHLSLDAVYLLWALGFSLLLSSLKTIPTVLMERKLEFNKYVLPQIVETTVFNLTAVLCAWQGLGVTSFTIAVVTRGIFGLVTTYIIQPWLPSFSFSLKTFKSILKFGVPYQTNTLLAMVKDDGMTLFLGGILGSSGVGLLGWAQKWAYAPLRFFMDQVIKVTFPAFSRLQENKHELSNAVTRSIFYICLLVFPSLVMLVLIAPSLMEIIPKYNKWNPALLALSILTINSALASITTPITNTLNAVGKVYVTFKLMIMWTVLTWIFVPVLALSFGVTGAAVGFSLVGLSSVIALMVALKYVQVNYLQVLGKPLIIAMILGVAVFIIRWLIPTSLIQVVIMITGGLITFLISIFLLEPQFLNYLKNKKYV